MARRESKGLFFRKVPYIIKKNYLDFLEVVYNLLLVDIEKLDYNE